MMQRAAHPLSHEELQAAKELLEQAYELVAVVAGSCKFDLKAYDVSTDAGIEKAKDFAQEIGAQMDRWNAACPCPTWLADTLASADS